MSLNKNKKALIFMIDVVIGLTVLLIGIFVMLNYFYLNTSSDQSADFASQISHFLVASKFGELNNFEIVNLTNEGLIDPDKFISEELSVVCLEGNQSFFEELMKFSVANIVPFHLNYSIAIINSSVGLPKDYCIEHPASLESNWKGDDVSISRTMILAKNETDIVGPYFLEVIVW